MVQLDHMARLERLLLLKRYNQIMEKFSALHNNFVVIDKQAYRISLQEMNNYNSVCVLLVAQ